MQRSQLCRLVSHQDGPLSSNHGQLLPECMVINNLCRKKELQQGRIHTERHFKAFLNCHQILRKVWHTDLKFGNRKDYQTHHQCPSQQCRCARFSVDCLEHHKVIHNSAHISKGSQTHMFILLIYELSVSFLFHLSVESNMQSLLNLASSSWILSPLVAPWLQLYFLRVDYL